MPRRKQRATPPVVFKNVVLPSHPPAVMTNSLEAVIHGAMPIPIPVALEDVPRQLRRRSATGSQRLTEDWPPCRRQPAYVEEVIASWMADHRIVRRPLTVGAPLLTLVCWLHSQGYPVPTRERMAEALETSKDAIDSARSTAIGWNEIYEIQQTYSGQVGRRHSTRRLRRLIPCDDLYEVYQRTVDARKRA